MKIFEEVKFDFDFGMPKVIVTGNLAIIENVADIKMVTENAVSISNGKKYVTVMGSNFTIKEIQDRRLIIEGKIQRVEFL